MVVAESHLELKRKAAGDMQCFSHRCGSTHADEHCLDFCPQKNCRLDEWTPPAPGSKRSNDPLLHKSDSTCVQRKNMVTVLFRKAFMWGRSSTKTVFFIINWKIKRNSINVFYYSDKAQEHHLVATELNCIHRCLRLQVQSRRTHVHIDPSVGWHTAVPLSDFQSEKGNQWVQSGYRPQHWSQRRRSVSAQIQRERRWSWKSSSWKSSSWIKQNNS